MSDDYTSSRERAKDKATVTISASASINMMNILCCLYIKYTKWMHNEGGNVCPSICMFHLWNCMTCFDENWRSTIKVVWWIYLRFISVQNNSSSTWIQNQTRAILKKKLSTKKLVYDITYRALQALKHLVETYFNMVNTSQHTRENNFSLLSSVNCSVISFARMGL